MASEKVINEVRKAKNDTSSPVKKFKEVVIGGVVVVIAITAAILSLLSCNDNKKLEEEQERIYAAETAIKNCSDVTLESGKAISDAEKVYAALNKNEKSQVQNHDVLVKARAEYDRISAVSKAIKDIGKVDATSGPKIEAAEKAYAALSDAEKKKITNYKDLVKAREEYDKIPKTEVLDETIKNFSEVTLDSGEEIARAERIYASLSDSEKKVYPNYDKIQDARESYDRIYAASNSIKNIGTVGTNSQAKIEAAEKAYAALSDEEKKQITNYKELTNARKSYDKIHAATEAIKNIGKVGTSSGNAIAEAEAAYNALSAEEKKQVTNYNELVNARNEYDKIPASTRVQETIDGLGNITLDSGAKIEAAEKAYADLSKSEKKQVTNYDELTNARTSYDKMTNTYDAIKNIGTVTLKSKTQIESAEKAYNALSAEEKKQITNYKELTSARASYDRISAAYDAIKNIGTVTSSSKAQIDAAEKAYNALSAEEKKQVTNYEDLVDAKAAYKALPQATTVTKDNVKGYFDFDVTLATSEFSFNTQYKTFATFTATANAKSKYAEINNIKVTVRVHYTVDGTAKTKDITLNIGSNTSAIQTATDSADSTKKVPQYKITKYEIISASGSIK